ncbi:MAG: hypothetical protein KatS3mg108_0313 [Isosphaeraceae bacterium]|jgi:4-amino-4-deoxy-L-arabinose transferase-like glycosyltransferase|nr:MAG: hypothetical protein KatS3mg108_0313 [Isosphaeraceae bacterium]
MTARDRFWMAGLVALTVVVRLPGLGAPLADALQAKQVYSANKARGIAGPPFDASRLTLGLLDERGRRLELVEEVPVYITVLAGLYRWFGESEVWGRLLSLGGAVVAVVAFVALVRREHGARAGWVGGLLLTLAPLFVFYGRAVMPDSWMLAAMVVTAWAYRRYWDGGRRLGWLVATVGGAVVAVGSKYWGLMILVVLAEMAWRAEGRRWRAWVRPSFLGMVVVILIPVALWMVLVFLRQRNPVVDGWTAGRRVSMPYLVFQDPSVLWDRRWYAAAVRFVVRDVGVVTAMLMVVGVVAGWRRREVPGYRAGGELGWTVMGGLFFVLLAPKLVDHDYYGLLMLPAASLWATRGYLALESRCWAGWGIDGGGVVGRWRRVGVVGILGLAVVVQGPWVDGSRFRVEEGKVALGRALAGASGPGGRVVVVGPGIALITALHYSGREGWVERWERLPLDWAEQVARWRRMGAECLGVYWDGAATAEQRAEIARLVEVLPVVERGRRGDGAYVVVRLDAEAVAGLVGGVVRR